MSALGWLRQPSACIASHNQHLNQGVQGHLLQAAYHGGHWLVINKALLLYWPTALQRAYTFHSAATEGNRPAMRGSKSLKASFVYRWHTACVFEVAAILKVE
jgi:hypothetical protein